MSFDAWELSLSTFPIILFMQKRVDSIPDYKYSERRRESADFLDIEDRTNTSLLMIICDNKSLDDSYDNKSPSQMNARSMLTFLAEQY